MEIKVDSQGELASLGKRLGAALKGGEVVELVGDVGAGKTTLVKAIAAGMGIAEVISSPSYTLSQVYNAPNGLRLAHYDFYRLDDPGILASELEEVVQDSQAVVAIEWGGIIEDVLPIDTLQIRITPLSENGRRLIFRAGGTKSATLMEQL